jgi:hypothetical protein
VGLTLGCALVAGIAVTAANAAASTPDTRSAPAPSTAAASPAEAAAPAPTDVEGVLALVRTRALAQQRAASDATVPGSSAVATAADSSEPPAADPTPEPTVEPTPGPTVEPTPEPTPPLPTDPPTDTTAPTGTFVLSTAGLWTGQKLTLQQTALADGGADTAGIKRVVTWGDGTSTTVAAGATTAAKAYSKKGKFTVAVTLTDAAGNTAKAKIAKPAITIAVPAATFKLSKSAVWHHESFKVTIAKVPSGTTKITLDRGDGARTALKGKNQSVTLSYHKRSGKLVAPGKITLRATFTNKNGAAAPVTVGKVTLKKDSWNPTVKFTKPAKSKASKASSWSTIRGTAADKGSGLAKVHTFAVRVNLTSGDAWCYTTKNKWLKLDFDNEDQNILPCIRTVKVTKGKWSYKLTGLKKGYAIGLSAIALDWVDRESKVAAADATLTRS